MKRHARRRADGRRGLPRAERGHPGDRPQGRARVRLLVPRVPRRLARPARGHDHAAGHPGGARPAAPRRHDPRLVADQPVRDRGRRPEDQAQPAEPRGGRADRDRRRGHARGRDEAARDGRQRRRRAQDDRQRPVGHRLHVRLRHRGEHRDRGHRPAAHHGREPPPGADRRGDGPARRLDRAARRDGRRGEHHPDPRGAVRHRPGVPVRRGPVPAALRADHRRLRGREAQGGRRGAAHRRREDAFGHVRLGGIGEWLAQRDRGAHRQGGPHHGARARAARRHPDGPRPLAGHPVRPARDRRGGHGASGAR